jgi:uncharacterized membrane protein YhaH (DUF805 family)
MLGFIFGLNARLGRWHYFLSVIGLAVAMTGICFVIARQTFENTTHGIPFSIEAIKGPAIVLGMIFALISFTLQSMRFRDIGWDPVCVIPSWIAILIVDTVVAKKFPGLALGPGHHGTAVSALVNLLLFLALLFWPGADYEDSPPPLSEPRRPDPSARGGGKPLVASERIARASGEFGRRAF